MPRSFDPARTSPSNEDRAIRIIDYSNQLNQPIIDMRWSSDGKYLYLGGKAGATCLLRATTDGFIETSADYLPRTPEDKLHPLSENKYDVTSSTVNNGNGSNVALVAHVVSVRHVEFVCGENSWSIRTTSPLFAARAGKSLSDPRYGRNSND